MSNKNGHGGKRKGAGRKPKAQEMELIQKLDNVINSEEVIATLKNMIEEGNFSAVKLYIEYRYGKAPETIYNVNENYNTDLTAEEIKDIDDYLESAY